MTNQKGFAQIPLILGLVAILAAIPFAVHQVQQSKILENKAASSTVCLKMGESNCFTTPCCQGFQCVQGKCAEISTHPSITPIPPISISPVPPVSNQMLPCSELKNAQRLHCGPSSSIVHTRDSVPCSDIVTALNMYCPEAKVTPVALPTIPPIPSCSNGQTRCVGHLLLTCNQGLWLWKDCGGTCINNRCSPFTK